MRIGRIGVVVSLVCAATAFAASPDAYPRAERRRVDEVRAHVAARRFAAADSIARTLVARAESGGRSGARWLPNALDLRALVLERWARPSDPDFVAVAERAVAARTPGASSDPVPLARALDRLGIAHLRRAGHRAADSLFTRAVGVLDSAGSRDARARAEALAWQAEGQRVARKARLAEETARRAITLLDGLEPREPALGARVHVTLGNLLSETGRQDEAIAAFERAIALESATASPDSMTIAATRRTLGRSQILADRLPLARAAFAEAAGIQERVLGADHPELATTLYMASFAEVAAGDFIAARRSAERSVAIREKAFGREHPLVAVALWQVGAAQREMGDPAGAVEVFRRSVTILRAAPTATPAELATGLSNLGATWLAAGDGARAREALDEAMAIREQVYGPGGGRSFWSLTRLAQALLLEGRSRDAVALLDTLLAGPLRRTAYDEADARERYAVALIAENDAPGALAQLDRAVAFHDSTLGIGSPRTLESLGLRAAARWASGRRAGALEDARRYERAALDFVRSAARGLSEREALEFEATRASGRDILLTLAADTAGLAPAARAEVLDAVVRSRLPVLDALADEARALPRQDPALAPLVAELEASRIALAEAMVSALRESRPPDSLAVAARARREAAERALAERSESFRTGARRSAPGAAEIADALPAGSALVSYVRFHSPRSAIVAGTPAEGHEDHEQYAALVLRAGERIPQVVRLGAGTEIALLVNRWLLALGTPPPPSPAAAAAAQRRCDAIGRAVRGRLWDPVARPLRGASRVFVVPDGIVHRVNLVALPDAGGRYLAESGPLLHRLTAERDLLPDGDVSRGSGLLALGGADFDRVSDDAAPLLAAAAAGDGIRAPSAIPDSLRVRFEPLPQTAAEVADIATLWRAAGSGDVVERTGAAASEAAFKSLAPSRRVLHLATHGFALGGPSRRAAEGTRGIGGVGSGERSAPRRVAALLPGLAFAGANVPQPPGAEDGFLTDEEITSLDLSGAEWAVLSACETGLSDPDAAEAVQGLHRSFRRAGVSTVIMSLWAVDDADTRAWMQSLYAARLERKTDTATAVHAATRASLAARRAAGLDTHPFHWAAFIASGDWR